MDIENITSLIKNSSKQDFLQLYNTMIKDVEEKQDSKRAAPILPINEMFSDHIKLSSRWEDIRKEALDVVKDALQADEVSSNSFGHINKQKKWKLYMLHFYGQDYVENMNKCPITTELIKSIPRIKMAMFSILEPGIHIPPHNGPFRGCMRYHLALQVPKEDGCYIEVGEKSYQWKEGDDVLFDDTYTHQVFNNTTEQRIILFCDIERELPGILGNLNKALIQSEVPKMMWDQ